ncbi:MAG TPA: thioesterase family protein [Ramlibacter sp.]|jgi:hypothetical protein|uniref:thioesterase family protein n=1 Tax=Ramlibacter sp. TaxID=1917967 RepID=UPI002D6FE621|nr:thioesterase family protein [Ramlibacter sp.]HZY17763.1 thioesterase family protein [Ramlibacter sp.]
MRNLLTVLRAAARPRLHPTGTVECAFRVMPWEVGLRTFRSDRYLAVAEAAQFDFVTRTGLLRPLLRQGIGWVNLAQASVFQRPLHLMQPFVVSTQVACVDDRHAYFSHAFSSGQGPHALVLVKAKFKQGGRTVPPESVLGPQPREKSARIQALDGLLPGAG